MVTCNNSLFLVGSCQESKIAEQKKILQKEKITTNFVKYIRSYKKPVILYV